MPLFSRLLRAGETKLVKRLGRIAAHIDTLEAETQALTDAELRAKTDEFRTRYAEGESLDELLPEAFAVVREAAVRTIGQRHFPVQLMGGAALHLGNIAEMKTGEGKTLTSVLPAYLNAISGDGVHLVTVNDYLAKRDAENMGRIHRFLGVSVGVILSEMTPAVRRRAVRRRHHLRHEQRVRLRLPARQHGVAEGRSRAARPQLRHRRRGRLDPDRRGPHAIDHLRARRAERALVPGVRADGADAQARRPLRGRRAQAHRGRHGGRRRAGRGPARDRQPLRGREHAARRVPEQRAEGQGAVQARQGLHRQRTARC